MATYPLISYRPDPELVDRVDGAAYQHRRSRQQELDYLVERGLEQNGDGPSPARTVTMLHGRYLDRLSPQEDAAFRRAEAALTRIAREDAAKEAAQS